MTNRNREGHAARPAFDGWRRNAAIKLVCSRVWKHCTMATDFSIDPALLAKAIELGGEKTMNATGDKTLQEFIARRERMRLRVKLRELLGQLEWSADFDCKRERTRP